MSESGNKVWALEQLKTGNKIVPANLRSKTVYFMAYLGNTSPSTYGVIYLVDPLAKKYAHAGYTINDFLDKCEDLTWELYEESSL